MSRVLKFRIMYKKTPNIWVKDEYTLRALIEMDGAGFLDDNDILEQYTGLKDKDGKEIYEGDIVFFFTEHFDRTTGGFNGEDEHNATVEWFDNGFAFMDKVPYDPNIECEVIGNIHENPELIGGEK